MTSQSVFADVPQDAQVAPAPRLAVSGRLIAILFVLAMAHLPLLVLHAQRLWSREHYQFFPILLPAAIVLAYRNVRGLGPLTPGRPIVCFAMFGLALVLLILGFMILSTWLGAVAAQVTLLATAFSLGGRRLVGALLPAWLLLFMAIPLPGPLDGRFVAALQRLAAIGASHVLEVVGVLHAREGNVLDIGGRCILVEEACSGVHSLFSVLACTLFWCAWMRRSPGHSLLLLLAAVPWVLAGNVARIIAVVVLDGVGGLNLNSGWGHEALGFCLFAGMLWMIWSTDHLLLLPTPWTQIKWREIWKYISTGTLEQQTGWTSKTPLPAQPLAAAAGSEPTRLPPLAATALSAWSILVCYGLVAVVEARAWGSQRGGLWLASMAPVELPSDTVEALETLDESTLPQQIGTWKRASFKVNEESGERPIGRYSRTWRYVRGDQSALAGIFYPYRGWKEVTVCYTSLGWTVEDRLIRNARAAGETGPYVIVRMNQPVRKTYSCLVFQLATPRAGRLPRLKNGSRSSSGIGWQRSSPGRP